MELLLKDELIKIRTPLRTNFTKAANKLREVLETEPINYEILDISVSILSDKFEKLEIADKHMINLLSKDTNISQDNFNEEYEKIASYVDEYLSLKTKAERLKSKQLNQIPYGELSYDIGNKKTVKLPKIELPKYDGSIKGWIAFWSLFKKIHDDPEITDEDKFVYLIQSTAERSRARDLVESFPPTAENYPFVIECLKSRFGKDELLIEVYVREMLSLVLNHRKCSLVNLYDKIETYLRALGTLGVTSDKYAAMLYPLVESCLPDDILKIWERNISSILVKDTEKEKTDKLAVLMEFLRSEVEGEQRLAIAKNSFEHEKEVKKSIKRYSVENKYEVPTAAELLNANENNGTKCIFCFKKHNSLDCNRAKTMSFNEKQELVKKAACCFRCLKKGHILKNCYSKIKCFRCDKLHCTIMCPKVTREPEINTSKTIETSNSNANKGQVLTIQSNKTEVLLQTLQVYLKGSNTKCIVRAIIDTGSQHSYISSRAVELVNYESIGKIPIVHSLFGGLESPQQIHRCHRVYLASLDDHYQCNFEALEQTKICGNIKKTPYGPWMKNLREKGIVLTDTEPHSYGEIDSEIHLLLGADIAGKLLNGKIQELDSGPVAVGTHLGWTLMGKIPQKTRISETCLSIISLLVSNIDLPDMWKLDRIGILDPVETLSKEEHCRTAYAHFQNNLKVNSEGRYEVKLPWLQLPPNVAEGKELAERRLKSTIYRLKEANILEAYQEILLTWLKEGIIEEVNMEKEKETLPGHFLPHRAVIKDSATTKIRPVFDASARTKNSPSLNECLHKGPNFLELIPTILTRFRMREFAVAADIKQAFLQISIFEKDRNFLKFLWMMDGNPTRLKTYRHCRVVFGLKCSPFLLSATLKHHLEKATAPFKNTALVLQDSFYVDNCLTSFDTMEDSELFIEQAQQLLISRKFDLRGWQRNYPLHDISLTPKENTLEFKTQKEELISVLGMIWDLHRDVLYCNLNYLEVNNPFPVTKRKILAIAQQIFDPLGMVCPFTLLPRILLQECWRQKLPWDKELPEDITEKFLYWLNQFALLKDISIPRWMMKRSSSLKHRSLHVFADASKQAYAVCVFIRIETEKAVSCEFIRAKNRVAPLKPITIPRLELLACLIAARLTDSIKRDMKESDIETYYWTDSSNALGWIKREDYWVTFIANRIKEIHSLSHPKDWHHLPGKFNPADIPSRGSTIKHLIKSKWLHGPEWLKSPKEHWPKSQIVLNEEELNKERRKSTLNNVEQDIPWYRNKCSSYTKLIRIIAWMNRFCDNARRAKAERSYLDLSITEIVNAELLLLKAIQREVFRNISNPILKPLRPQYDEKGIIRVTTRLIQREDTESFKRPIVLPNKHPVVCTMILEHHKRMSHAGVQTLMTLLRENYWILQCRKTVRQVLRNCTNCRRFETSKTEVLPAPLPEKRIKDAAAFEVTGIDLGGPLYLRNGEKTWFVLFTCATIRAVHIELVTTLSTETFLLAFRRFVSRRGRPLTVYTDNGTNFTGANNIFHSINWEKVKEMSTLKRIEWIFIPPAAPWWGGWWERLIGMIKQNLKRVLGRARLNYDELYTVLCEAENMLNNRPLTYLSEDVEDLQPLTPSLFLQELRYGKLPELDVIDSAHLNKRFRYRQKLKEDLMKRIRIEYLGQLKNPTKGKLPTTLKVGQIVLVGNDNIKRIDWPMARILELYPGKDNIPRVARIKTTNGELIRPYQRLYPMEVEDEDRSLLTEKSPSPIEDKDRILLTEKSPSPIEDKDRIPLTERSPSAETFDLNSPVRITRSGRMVKPVKRLDL